MSTRKILSDPCSTVPSMMVSKTLKHEVQNEQLAPTRSDENSSSGLLTKEDEGETFKQEVHVVVKA